MVAEAGLKQFHAAESEKFAHVTSFFNGGKMDPLPGEDRLIVSSPDNTNNYVDHPEMSAERIADTLIQKIQATDINFYVANFANADMVGHTGSLNATIEAIRAIDTEIGKIADAVLAAGGCLLITADHGNAEQMINLNSGEINKDHTTAPVPFILVANEFKRSKPKAIGYENLASLVPEGALSDVAPTILDLMGLPKPDEMTGISLVPVFLEQIGVKMEEKI